MTKEDLNSIAVPTVLIPGNDQTHASENGRIAARAIPGCVLHQLPIEDQQVPLIGFPEWAPHYDEITRVFIDLMNRSLLSGYLPMEAGRAAGLTALASFAPLRRFAMSMGLGR